ncbi:MAG: signal peptidase I [Dehalobacterium sp.]
MGKFARSLFRGLKGSWGEALEVLSLAVILAIIMRIFLWEPYYIPSGSMSPVLKPGDKILVNKLVYRLEPPRRGDIVVFKFPLNEKKEYIKRIIALPGETIEGKDNKILINGQKLREDYLQNDRTYDDFGPVQMGQEEYYVLGDNRKDSEDSRFWGPLDGEKIRGKAMLIYWPIRRLTWLS